MARYRLFSQDSEINVGRRVLRAGDDGVFDVADGSADEATLIAAGAVPAVGQTAAQAAAMQAAVSGDGFGATPRTVLFGDSMTAFYHQQINPTSATYDAATGVITCTYAGHQLWTGARAQVYNLNWTDLRDPRWLPVTVVDANVYTVTLPDKPQTLPATLTTGMYTHFETRLTAYSWVGMLQRRLNHRLNIVAHSAQSGDWSRAARSRLQRDVLDYKPDLVLMQCLGINDQTLNYLGETQTPEDTTIANIKAIIDGILASGARLLIGTITAPASGEARATLGVMSRVQRINRWIKDYCTGRPRCAVADFWDATVDRLSTAGVGNAADFKASDKIHYSVVGALKAAKRAEAIISAWFPSSASTLPASTLDCALNQRVQVDSGSASGGIVTLNRTSGVNVRSGEWFRVSGATPAQANISARRALTAASNNQSLTYAAPGIADGALTGTIYLIRSRNVWPDPLLQAGNTGTASSGVTGTVKRDLLLQNNAGNTGTLTAVATVAAEPNGYGNEQVITVTAAAANDVPVFKQNGTLMQAEMQGGRSYVMEFQLRLASTSWVDTPLLTILAQFQVVDTSTGLTHNVNLIEGADGTTGTAAWSENQTLHLRSPALAIPAGAVINPARLQVLCTMGAGITNSASLTLGLSRIAVWDVTPD